MPLSAATLEAELLIVLDPQAPSYTPPADAAAAAANWARAVRNYFASVTNPAGVTPSEGSSAQLDAAEGAMRSTLTPLLVTSTTFELVTTALDLSLAAFTGFIGVPSPPGVVVTPPPPVTGQTALAMTPLQVASRIPPGPTAADAASKLATTWHSWFVTGTTVTRGAAPVNWL